MSTIKLAKTLELNNNICIYIDDRLLPYGEHFSFVEVAPPICSLFLYQIIASLSLLNACAGRYTLTSPTRARVLILICITTSV